MAIQPLYKCLEKEYNKQDVHFEQAKWQFGLLCELLFRRPNGVEDELTAFIFSGKVGSMR